MSDQNHGQAPQRSFFPTFFLLFKGRPSSSFFLTKFLLFLLFFFVMQDDCIHTSRRDTTLQRNNIHISEKPHNETIIVLERIFIISYLFSNFYIYKFTNLQMYKVISSRISSSFCTTFSISF